MVASALQPGFQSQPCSHSLICGWKRELALLCQRVEKTVFRRRSVRGVMDQMVSSCGEEHRLLALLCQPAELLGLAQFNCLKKLPSGELIQAFAIPSPEPITVRCAPEFRVIE